MVRKPMLLVLIGITLFGCLGGLIAAFVRHPTYQSDAIVIVYEMPHDQRELIEPDYAQQIDDFYRAGALQPKVAQDVLQRFPGMTIAELRSSVQISIISFTPLTRITATASTPQRAADLANTVANVWTSLAASVNDHAWTETTGLLEADTKDLDNRIASTQQAILDAQAAGADVSTLKSQLTTEMNQLTATHDRLLSLYESKLVLIGNASVTTLADPSVAERSPDPIKYVAAGGIGGFALGLIFVIWLLRREYFRRTERGNDSPDYSPSPFKDLSTGVVHDAR